MFIHHHRHYPSHESARGGSREPTGVHWAVKETTGRYNDTRTLGKRIGVGKSVKGGAA